MSTDKPIFKNFDSFQDFIHWDGKEVEIMGVLANPEDDSILDPDAMPQFSVKLVESGEINNAYVDEIDEKYWTDEMKAVLEGQKAFANRELLNPYSCSLAQFFDYGLKLGEIKNLHHSL